MSKCLAPVPVIFAKIFKPAHAPEMTKWIILAFGFVAAPLHVWKCKKCHRACEEVASVTKFRCANFVDRRSVV